MNPASQAARALRSRAGQRGYTLLEVLVAFALLAIGLGLLLSILSSAMHGIARSSQSTQAALYAENLLDTLGADQRLHAGHSEGRFENGRYRWSLEIAPYPMPAAQPQQADPFASAPVAQNPIENVMLHVVLRMQWGEQGDEQSLRVETLRAYTPQPLVQP